MGFPQDDYAGRLPYGYWFSPSQGREYLFDRGYNAIASRPIEKPWEVTIYPKRRFIDAGPGRVEKTFYTDGITPRRNNGTLAMCERVTARFCMGRDVRAWLRGNREKKISLPQQTEPKTGANYLPDRVAPRQMTLLTPDEIGLEMA